MGAFEDPSVKAIVSLRGGFGCSRLIHLIGQGRLRRHCKIFMGFSDLTTLHLYFRRRFGWVTFHGPMATSPALGNIGREQEKHLLSLWTDPSYLPDFSFPDLEAWAPGTAEGELTGGCLSLVVASLGTPYEIATEGKVLFLEDLGEPPYRIDRMLTQLRLARKLDGIAGVLLGSFQDCEPAKPGTTAAEVLRDILMKLEVPVIANFPAGHGDRKLGSPPGNQNPSGCRRLPGELPGTRSKPGITFTLNSLAVIYSPTLRNGSRARRALSLDRQPFVTQVLFADHAVSVSLDRYIELYTSINSC